MEDRKGVSLMSKKHKKHRPEMSEEPFLLSPEFEKSTGWGKNFADWWQRYFKSVILPAIIVILIAGGIYAYTSRQQEPTENEELSQTATEQNEGNLNINENTIQNEGIKNTTENESTDTLALGEPENQNANEPEPSLITPTPTNDGEKITQKTVKGDGLTHLARRALKDYIAQNQPDLKLSAEQKIYCEDYIQKNTRKDIGQKSLSIGQEVSFDSTLMDNAIAKAQQLSDKQLENLSKYVPLVPSLNT